MANRLLLKLVEASGLFWLGRYRNRHQPIVLMYHRVVSEPLLPGINPSVFEQQLKYLKAHFTVMPMAQLADDIRNNQVKPYSLAITFDDGHGDFYTHAWPLLRKYNLPASLYVTTGFVDQKYWLWPDLLRYLLIKTPKTSLNIPTLGNITLSQDSVLKTWNTLGDYCLTLNTEDRWQFLQQLAKQLDIEPGESAKPPFHAVTWDQLREMQTQGLEVGSHTLSHPILSALSPEQLEQELHGSYEQITQELGTSPLGICYPNGMAKDTSSIVERVGSTYYRYGLVAYPAKISAEKTMHIGRWAAPSSLARLKVILCGLSRNDNHQGEYR